HGSGVRRPSLIGARLQQGFTIGGMGLDVILRSNNPPDRMSALGFNNGHRDWLKECPLYPQKRTLLRAIGMAAWVKSGLMHCSKFYRYSITWSACASSAAG